MTGGPPGERWLLRSVEVDGVRTDCRLAGGMITELAPGLRRQPGEQDLDADGGALLPGLADHHVHLAAIMAARRSLDLGGAALPELGETSAALVPGGAGWLRLFGLGVEVSRADLDERWPDRPVRAQHRSGALWTLNTAALQRLDGPVAAEEQATGQFWRAGSRLRQLLGDHAGSVSATELGALGRELLTYGLTHLTDATPDLDPAALAPLANQALPQRVLSLAASGTGPRKIVLPDHEPPDLKHLINRIEHAHATDRGVALHVVTAVTLAVALAAFDEVGAHPDDRIEHAAVCDDAAAARIAELDLTVVTQPSLFARHGHRFVAETEPGERRWLWRYGGLLRAGARVVASSDAPYGDPNPWQTIHDAARRRTDGSGLESGEQVEPIITLASLLTDPRHPGRRQRHVRPGVPADLCLLHQPLDSTLRALEQTTLNPVRAAFVAGRCQFRSAGAGRC